MPRCAPATEAQPTRPLPGERSHGTSRIPARVGTIPLLEAVSIQYSLPACDYESASRTAHQDISVGRPKGRYYATGAGIPLRRPRFDHRSESQRADTGTDLTGVRVPCESASGRS